MHATRSLSALLLLIGILGYPRLGDAWTHEAQYKNWGSTCPTAMSVGSYTVFHPIDVMNYSAERFVSENWYFRDDQYLQVDNSLNVIEPASPGVYWYCLAFRIGGIVVSQLPPEHDAVYLIEAHARFDYQACWPGMPDLCWWTVAGPGDGDHAHVSGPIDP